jgi:hypothetical protein
MTWQHLAHWTYWDTAFVSCVFSWDLPKARKLALYYASIGYKVRAGGPAVDLDPGALSDVAEIGGSMDALPRHNPDATFTSRGCIRRCAFCAVPQIEGELRELADWVPRPVVCDNNLLACSRTHFDRVIDRLKPLSGVDFNQGLDARLLTKYHAEKLAGLDLRFARLAWDNVATEAQFRRAWETLRAAGIPKRTISVYVLIGFRDTPADALYRMHTVTKELDSMCVPMRYQPLGAKRRNEYIDPSWTHWELVAYKRYWGHRRTTVIPFDEWLDTYRPAMPTAPEPIQREMSLEAP